MASPGTTASRAAQVLKEPTTPEMTEMVENMRRAGAIPPASEAGTATQATRAAQVLKTPSTPEMAEMVENIRRTQAADQAAVTASRVAPAATQATAATTTAEAANGTRAGTSLAQTAEGVTAASRALGGLGVLGGGLELYSGIQKLRHGETQQGVLDVAAGGLGTVAGGMALAGAACPPLALAAAGVGAMAYGNEKTKQWGMWGKNAEGENRSSFDFVGDTTSAAYRNTRRALGGGVLGTAAGGLAAGATALGTGTAAVVEDVIGGVAGAAQGVGQLGLSAARGVGHLASSAASGVGHFASRLAHW